MRILGKKKSSKPSFWEEQKLWDKGFEYVVGLDEVGRGSFAGSVVVGAVVFLKDTPSSPRRRILLADVNDSKLLKPLVRLQLSKVIKENALFALTASISVSEIDKIGIGKATQKAFRKVIGNLHEFLNKDTPCPSHKGVSLQKVYILIDGFHVKYIKGIGLKNQKAIVKGDQKSFSIAAASIIAKVYRDKLMKSLHRKYPHYHFSKNKGYGTKEHQNAIIKYGLSKVHRRSFNLSKILIK